MKTRRGFLTLQSSIILVFIILNAVIFYIINCNGAYLQSRDVWGNTQSIMRTDFKSRQRLLENYAGKGDNAVAEIGYILAQMEENERAKKKKGDKDAESQIYLPVTEKKENYQAVQGIISDAVAFSGDVQSIGDKARSMSATALYNQGWFLSNIAKSERDYYGLDYVSVSPIQDEAWNVLINFRVSDLLVCGMAVTLAVLLFFYWQNQIEGMIPITGDVIIKCCVLLFTGFLGIYAGNLLIKELYLEVSRFNLSLQSLQSFRSCRYILTIGGFIIIWLMLKLSAGMLVFMTMLWIMSHDKKEKLISGIVVALVAALEYMLGRYRGEMPVLVFLREINLFSALSPERFFNRYLNLNIGGNAYSRLPFFLVFWCTVLGVMFYVCFRRLGMHQRLVWTKAQQNYYEEINRQYMETRRLWHDFQNHLLAIQALNESGDREGADRYVKELNESISTSKLAPKTGCNPVDLLLYKKQEQAAEQGINLRLGIQCKLGRMGFAGYDLCSVIGNLLDNALEAVADITDEDRIIELELKQQQGMLLITCNNPYRGQLKGTNGMLLTTKKDKGNHGIGLSSIRQVCRKYQGTMEIQTEDGMFRVHILLMEKQGMKISVGRKQ